MCLYSSLYSSSVTESFDRAHRAFIELTVSVPGSSPSSAPVAAMRMGQVMKSEYRLTISLIFQGEV